MSLLLALHVCVLCAVHVLSPSALAAAAEFGTLKSSEDGHLLAFPANASHGTLTAPALRIVPRTSMGMSPDAPSVTGVDMMLVNGTFNIAALGNTPVAINGRNLLAEIDTLQSRLASLEAILNRNTFVGDFDSRQAGCSLETLHGYTKIVGNLHLESCPDLDLSPLAHLDEITGYIRVLACGSFTNLVAFTRLRKIGDYLSLESNSDFASAHLPSLETVGSWFVFQGSQPLLTTITAPKLTTIGHNVVLASQVSLSIVSLPALTSVGGDYILICNTDLDTLSVVYMPCKAQRAEVVAPILDVDDEDEAPDGCP